MHELRKRWPESSGAWKQEPRTLIVSNNGSLPGGPDEVLVKTPLDMIVQLEGTQPISKVVLAGVFASRELASFVLETYPWVGVELPA